MRICRHAEPYVVSNLISRGEKIKVSQEDAKLFIKLYQSLIYYVIVKYDLLDMENPEEIKRVSLEETKDLRDELYNHPEVIQEFIEENPFNFSPNELDIIREWNHFVKGRFIIFRSLKKYTIFLDLKEESPKVYGVLALYHSFEEVVGPLPVMADAILLPFKGKIVYDGIVNRSSLTFGSSARRNFNDAYQKAKFRFGIIESLPFSAEGEKSDEEKLTFYLKSERNRDQYWEEIWELIDENPALITVYHQEMGKAYARTLAKDLRKMGVRKGWFAVFEGLTIASGTTKDDTEKVVKSILPEKKWKFVYYFQLKLKR